MSVIKSGVKAHDDACAKAEGARQVAVASASNQGAVRSAEVTYYQTVKASAISNNISPSVFADALRSLGQTG
jgi:hypothetical protein